MRLPFTMDAPGDDIIRAFCLPAPVTVMFVEQKTTSETYTQLLGGEHD
jgi:hypothetical protein